MRALNLEVLAFAAEHQVICAEHVRRLLGISQAAARRHLAGLGRERLVRRTDAVDAYAITRRGLDAVGSRLPVPKARLHAYRHDVGVAWLWLAARAGAFGALRTVISERELRSRDGLGDRPSDELGSRSPEALGEGFVSPEALGERFASPEAQGDRFASPLGVRLGGLGPGGRERLHYPDLVLVAGDGRRVAVELELTGKGPARRERILSGYAADPRIDAVLYLVQNRRVGNPVAASAARLGISSLVHVQTVRLGPGAGPSATPGRAVARHSRAEAVARRSRAAVAGCRGAQAAR